MPDKNWQFELEEYIRQGEPDRAEKSGAWQTAIGLQAVDGLNTSTYLLDTAKDHIEGKITIDEAQKRIHSYYEQRIARTEFENETKEADIVSARIAKLLGEKAFQFSPIEWISIHRRLFEGVFSHAGKIRQYNITKKEWVLGGDTVIYADYSNIKDILDYVDEYVPQSIKAKASKYQFDTLDCSLEKLAILKLIAKNPTVKQQELVNATGKSIATVKRIMKSLREKNYIRRENGKRYGKWEMLI